MSNFTEQLGRRLRERIRGILQGINRKRYVRDPIEHWRGIEQLEGRLLLSVTTASDTFTTNEDTLLSPIVFERIVEGTGHWHYLESITNGQPPHPLEDYPLDGNGLTWNDTEFDVNSSDAGIGQWQYGVGPFEAGNVQGIRFGGVDFTSLFGLDDTINGKNSVSTYLFRSESFDVENSTRVSQLRLNYIVDDGAIVYLNGEEIYRTENMAGLDVGTNTFSNGAGNENEYIYAIVTIDPGLLQDENNIIAVELHQVSDTSADVGIWLDVDAVGAMAANILDNDNLTNVNGLATVEFVGNDVTGGIIKDIDGITDAGVVTLFENGNFNFLPEENYHGTASFEYVVRDDDGVTAPETVMIEVLPVNDAPPVGESDHYIADEGESIVAMDNTRSGVLSNDPTVDVDGEALTAELVPDDASVAQLEAAGEFIFNADGTFSFDPDHAHFIDTITFHYHLVDPHGATGPATAVTLVYNTVDSGPVITMDDHFFAAEDERAVIDVSGPGIGKGLLANDTTHPDDFTDPVEIIIVKNAGLNYFQLNSDGSFSFLPPSNFHGDLELVYQVDDGFHDPEDTTATAIITVQNTQNDPPSGNHDYYYFNHGRTLSITEQGYAPQITLIRSGDDWEYHDDIHRETETYPQDHLGRVWYTPNYDTTSLNANIFGDWQVAPTPFEDPNVPAFTDDSTRIDKDSEDFTTFLFRRVIEIPNGSSIDFLDIEYVFDDGAVVYLNGHEIKRINMPDDPINTDTMASRNGEEDEYLSFTAHVKGLLVDGDNVFAVELHQEDMNSNDLGFDLIVSGSVSQDGLFANDSEDVDGDELSIVLEDDSVLAWMTSFGELTVHQDGTFQYTLEDLSYAGNGYFNYRLFDGVNYSSIIKASIDARRTYDYDQNQIIDASDIDLLNDAITKWLADDVVDVNRYDLSGDGKITQDDMDDLIQNKLGTVYGDANLDRIVNVADLALLANRYGQQDHGWSGGDFNGDGIVDLRDLSKIASNWKHEPVGGTLNISQNQNNQYPTDTLDWSHIDSILDE